MGRWRFTKEFKREVVQQVEAGMSAAEASRRYELHPNLIGKWRELFGKYGPPGQAVRTGENALTRPL